VPTQTRRLGYVPQLDGLRAIAILLVVIVHINNPSFLGGWLGVELFFVLSGFLITSLLTQEHDRSNSIAVGNFYMRRVLRLTPALWVFLAVAVIWEVTHPGATSTYLDYIFYALTFRANFYSHWPPAGVGHLWTLSLEDQFYFVWPIILLISLRRGGRELAMKVAVAGIVLSIASGIGLVIGREGILTIYHSSELNLQALFIGCVCGLMLTGGQLDRFATSKVLRVGTVVGTAILLLSIVGPNWQTNSWFFAGPLAFYCLMCAVVVAGVVLQPTELVARGLSKPLMVWVGKLSYSIYLWHLWVFDVLVNHTAPIGACEAILITMALAIFSYYVVEQPFDRLKTRFQGRQRPAALIEELQSAQ
jgi:peptidoglycan/LPS O-acetylase OafA/YrhL